MKPTLSAFLRVLALIAALWLAIPAAPLAQAQITSSAGGAAPTEPEQIRPPTPGKQDSPPVVLYWITLGLTVLLVVGVNLMPSKRGHQD